MVKARGENKPHLLEMAKFFPDGTKKITIYPAIFIDEGGVYFHLSSGSKNDDKSVPG